MTSAATTATTASAPATSLLRALQVLSALAVVNVAVQFVTAGQLFGQGEGPEGAHAAGAIVLHVVTGLAAVAAVLLAVRQRAWLPIAALAVVSFGYSFIQAAIGGRSSLYVHVPGAMLMTALVVWLLIAALRGPRRAA